MSGDYPRHYNVMAHVNRGSLHPHHVLPLRLFHVQILVHIRARRVSIATTGLENRIVHQYNGHTVGMLHQRDNLVKRQAWVLDGRQVSFLDLIEQCLYTDAVNLKCGLVVSQVTEVFVDAKILRAKEILCRSGRTTTTTTRGCCCCCCCCCCGHLGRCGVVVVVVVFVDGTLAFRLQNLFQLYYQINGPNRLCLELFHQNFP